MLVLSLFVLIVGSIYLYPWVYRVLQVQRWKSLDGKIALTYDDGPDQETTNQVLDVLEQCDIAATFYLVGFRAQRCPQVLARLKDSPHLLGSHSHLHKHAWKVPPWVELRDTRRGMATLAHVLEQGAPYRPPFGKMTLISMAWLWLKGSQVHWWSFDTHDTGDKHEDVDSLATHIVNSRRPVVLMHCHHGEPHRREFVVSLTRAIITEANRKGLQFVTMNELGHPTDA